MPTGRDIPPHKGSYSYSLATAAYNEEKIIEQTIRSIVNQTVKPRKWIIVSDGSTDHTDEIVKSYAAKHEFIELERISEDHPRNFTAQVNAINRGFSKLKELDSDFIAGVWPSHYAFRIPEGDSELGNRENVFVYFPYAFGLKPDTLGDIFSIELIDVSLAIHRQVWLAPPWLAHLPSRNSVKLSATVENLLGR